VRALILEHRQPPTPTTLSMPPFTPKNREQKDQRKGENEERNIFFERERREKSLNFFFRTEQTAKEGDSSSGVFFGEETKKDEFHRFWREISRGTSSSSSNVTSPARALRITTHE